MTLFHPQAWRGMERWVHPTFQGPCVLDSGYMEELGIYLLEPPFHQLVLIDLSFGKPHTHLSWGAKITQ